MISPNKFILLRSNHEVREVQKHNSFHKECIHKYGEKLGQNVWQIINSVFDKLPLSVIIDESIFCAHGGIPMSCSKVNQTQSIILDLKNPEKDSAIAWELLNNDPFPRSLFGKKSDQFGMGAEPEGSDSALANCS
jgi:hypothetical protein